MASLFILSYLFVKYYNATPPVHLERIQPPARFALEEQVPSP
jgi:hypothetical protein